jgi:hypothetical protein
LLASNHDGKHDFFGGNPPILLKHITMDDSFYERQLHRFRMLYNAALFNEWAKVGLYEVHKSKRHNDGSICFGGEMFLVAAKLPTGVISNHYDLRYWNLFAIPSEEKSAFPYDGHMPADVMERIEQFLKYT